MALLLAAATAAGAPAPTAGTATATELHAAQCTAALQDVAAGQARTPRGAGPDARRILLETWQAAYAFQAAALLAGGADERRAWHLVGQARHPGAAAGAGAQAVTAAACLDEGRRLFLGLGGLERAVVSRRAEAHVGRPGR